MSLALAAVISGLILLVWSADRFVEGAAATARHFGMPALLIGMVIVGFGTSAPEMVVSALAATQGNPGIALGNAYGSNITNIALILGVTALISPILVQSLGVSDLIIGLTIVAVGTSLPELASSVIAARKGEHDIALGNIIGSNLFNTLAVVGIAGVIHPMAVSPEVLSRDMLVMIALTVSLFVIGYGFRKTGRINRLEGTLLLMAFLGYTTYLVSTVFIA